MDRIVIEERESAGEILRMIKAYHWVPKDAFQKILKEGSITPAIDRVDPELFREDCKQRIEGLKAFVKTPDLVGLQALERLVQDRISAFEDWQGIRASEASQAFTQFGCVDFLAGDAEQVFLQVGQWPDWAGDSPTGFVFDAEQLVREGAVLREKDLAPLYWRLLSDFLAETWLDLDEAWDWLLEKFHRLKEEYQYRGKRAIAELRGKKRRRFPQELLWNGLLPVDLSIEVLHEGVPVEPKSVLG